MGASVLNRDGKETTPIMGSYGIGMERILTAAIEQSAGEVCRTRPGLTRTHCRRPLRRSRWSSRSPMCAKPELLAAGEKIAQQLSAAGIDVLLDDRDERAGVKFKDAELIGVPFRIAMGKKLAEGKVELLNRLTDATDDIAVGEAVEHDETARGRLTSS